MASVLKFWQTRRTPSPPAQPVRVLNLCANGELGLLRSTILRANGFEVDSPNSEQDILGAIEQRTYDVALICHSISPEAALKFANHFLKRHPDKWLIYVAKTPWEQSPINANVSVSAIDGPELLIRTLHDCSRVINRADAA